MLTITLTGGNAVTTTQRVFIDALKSAAEATVEHWHENYLPIHFTEAGFDRYNYQLRKGQDESNLIYSQGGSEAVRLGRGGRLIKNPHYYWRKWRKFRTHDPLVYTGTSKSQAEQSIRVSSKTTAGGAVIQGVGIMDLPKYFYQYNKSVGAPDKVDELTRTTAAEDAELVEFYNNAVGAHLAAVSAPSTSARIA